MLEAREFVLVLVLRGLEFEPDLNDVQNSFRGRKPGMQHLIKLSNFIFNVGGYIYKVYEQMLSHHSVLTTFEHLAKHLHNI